MAKISSYPEATNIDPEMFIAIEPLVHDQKYKTHIGNLSIFPYRNKMHKAWHEFDKSILSIGVSPFATTAISTGTIGPIAQEANHPGITRITSGAAANTGHVVSLGGVLAVLIGGGEVGEFIFRCPTITGVVFRLGFFDVVTTAAPVDSVELTYNGVNLTGRTNSNSVNSITATSFAVVANTWYRGKVEVNAAATLVTYTLYNSAGTVLWTDSLSANIPTATGRETGFGALAYKNSVNSANILDLDWMAYYNTKALVR